VSEGTSRADPVLEEIIEQMREILGRLRYVATGDVVRPEDHNDLVDFAVKTLELASRLTASGVLPPWVPILDIGKLDYMIVGEPRRPVAGGPPKHAYWERKPIFGYIYEDDVNSVVIELNSLLNEEVLPRLRFGDRFTSDQWNSWWDWIDSIAQRAGLPYRVVAVESDAPPSTLARISLQWGVSQIVKPLASLSVRVEVR